MYEPVLSVIVLNFNGRKYIERCLDSLLKTKYDKMEIIVVDNASTDGSKELIKRKYPRDRILLVENSRNLGFCAGNNIGIKKATGDLIILLNNDTVVNENWIKKILKEAESPEVGVIGCKVLFPSGKIIQSWGCKERFLGYWEDIGAGYAVEEIKDRDGIEVDYVSGAAIAIKREVIEKIGQLDPRFFAYVEEVDLCYRAKKAGYKIVISNAIVYHYGSAYWRNFPLKKFYLIYRNKILFIVKNYPKTALVRYLIEYPIRFTYENLKRVLKNKTVTQRISALHVTSDDSQSKILQLLKMYLLNVFFFYLTIIPGLKLSLSVLHQYLNK